jgi:hypothetical protein
MTDKSELRKSVIDALPDQKRNKAKDYLPPDEIANTVENWTGQKPSRWS